MSEIKYLIFGNGWLGNRFHDYFRDNGDNIILLRERIGRITTEREIKYLIREYEPSIAVINCIGKTGKPNIDWCESHKEDTFFSNVTVPMMIAEVCEDMDKYMVHLGSGCIFEGDNYGDGYNEYDHPNFRGSFYSRTKIYSEQILREYKNILQLRIRMPCDSRPSQRNLIDKLIVYKQVIDTPNSITYIPDFLKISKELMDRKEIGIYNVVNEGTITHNIILQLYKELVDPLYELPEFITEEELSAITKTGRSNCMLVNDRLHELGIKIRDVEEAVRDCLIKYKIYKDKMK